MKGFQRYAKLQKSIALDRYHEQRKKEFDKLKAKGHGLKESDIDNYIDSMNALWDKYKREDEDNATI